MENVLRLTLDHTGEEITALWQINPGPDDPKTEHRSGWPAYPLNEKEVREAAKQIDACLKALTGLEWPKTFDFEANAPGLPSYDKEMRALADAGLRLRQALLTGKRTNPRGVKVAKAFSEWFDVDRLQEKNPDNWRIEVVHMRFPDERYFPQTIPWGICYNPHPDDEKTIDTLDPKSPTEFSGFWCQKFRLAVRSKDANLARVEAARNHDPLRMGVWLEKPTGGRSRIEETIQRAATRDRKASKADEVIAENFERYRQKFSDVIGQNDYDSYLYLSLCADNEQLGPDRIEVPDIERLRGQGKTDRVMLVVLDGDAVIRGDRGIAWLQKVMKLGENGLIATEVDVDNPALQFFGWRILNHILLSRKPLIEAVDEFRQQMWPLGLLYGVYCNPLHIYSDPPAEAEINSIGTVLKERLNAS